MPNCVTSLYFFLCCAAHGSIVWEIMCRAVSRNCVANLSPSPLHCPPHSASIERVPGKMSMLNRRPFLARGKRSNFGSIPRSFVFFGPTDRTNEHSFPLLIRHIWFAPLRSLEISSESRVLRRKQWIDSCRLQRLMALKWRPTGRQAASRTQENYPRVG